MEGTKDSNPEKAIKLALTTASTLGSQPSLEESQRPVGLSTYASASGIFVGEVSRLRDVFEEKLHKIKSFLETFEGQFFAKTNEFFMELVVAEVNLTKNVEYDMNNQIKVGSPGCQAQDRFQFKRRREVLWTSCGGFRSSRKRIFWTN